MAHHPGRQDGAHPSAASADRIMKANPGVFHKTVFHKGA
jgi:hypothetical protein